MLKTNGNLKKYFFNTNWLFLEKFFRMFVSLTIGIMIARYLGPEKFGIISYAIVLASFITPFWRMGLNSIINKKFIEGEESESKLFGTAIYSQFIAYFLVAIFFIFVIINTSLSDTEQIICIIVFLGNLFLISDIFDQYFNAKTKSKYISYASIWSNIVTSIVKIIFIVYEFELIYFAIAISLEFVIKALLLTYYVKIKEKFSFKNWHFDISIFKNIFKESWPFILTGTMTGLYMKIDQLMIKYYIGNEAVGLYSVAVRLSEFWFVIPVVLTQSLFPAILNAKKKDKKLFEDRVTALYSLLVTIGLVIGLIFSLFSEVIIGLLFGVEYIEAALILSIYVWAVLFIFINNAQWKWYLSMGYQKLALLRISIGAILNIILNIIFLNMLGLIGAAYATIITYAYVGYFGNFISYKLRPNFYMITKAILCPVCGIKLILKGSK